MHLAFCPFLLLHIVFIRFVKGSKPGHQSGFDIDEADLMELQQFHEVIVASAIFGIYEHKTLLKYLILLSNSMFLMIAPLLGNYDIIQQPKNISDVARRIIPFYMFIDEETEEYMKNSSVLDSSKRVGLWRVIVVRNIPYSDPRRNGKVCLLYFLNFFLTFDSQAKCSSDQLFFFIFLFIIFYLFLNLFLS